MIHRRWIFGLLATLTACQGSSGFSPHVGNPLSSASGVRQSAVRRVVYGGFGKPAAVAVSGSTVYVADPPNHEIVTANASGSIGFSTARFDDPVAVAAAADGTLYVLDAKTARLYRVLGNGKATILGPRFSKPRGVAVDSSGVAYVADQGTSAIVKVSPSGTTANVGHVGEPFAVAAGSSGELYVAAGDSDNGQLYVITPKGKTTALSVGGNTYAVAVDSLGQVYVENARSVSGNLDTGVYKVLPSGLREVVSYFDVHTPGLAVDASGKIYVLERGAVDRWSPGARSPVALGLPAPLCVAVDPAGNLFVATVDGTFEKSAGSNLVTPYHAPVSAYSPRGLASDAGGNVYVADEAGVHRVAPNGTVTNVGSLEGAQGIYVDLSGNAYVAVEDGGVQEIAPDGSVIGRWDAYSPVGVVVDRKGTVYASNYQSVLKFSSPSEWVAVAKLTAPEGMAADSALNVYVADAKANAVYAISKNAVVTTVAAGFLQPLDVAVDPQGSLYVADYGHGKVVEISR